MRLKKNWQRLSLTLISLLVWACGFGTVVDSLNMSVSCDPVVECGKYFTIEYKVQSGVELKDIQPVTIDRIPDGLKLLAGPSLSTTSSYTSVDGNVSASYSVVFTYIFRPVECGEYRVRMATLHYKGEELLIKSYKRFKVVDKVDDKVDKVRGDTVFARVEIDRDKVMLGDSLDCKVVIYYDGVLSALSLKEPMEIEGCLCQAKTVERIEPREVTIGNRRYNKVEMLTYKVTPLVPGRFNVNPIKIAVGMRRKTLEKEGFFEVNRYEDVETVVETPSVSFEVAPKGA